MSQNFWEGISKSEVRALIELNRKVKTCRNCIVLEAELREAYTYVEMAGGADNSGGEYNPRCQCCDGVLHQHDPDCALNQWLIRHEI